MDTPHTITIEDLAVKLGVTVTDIRRKRHAWQRHWQFPKPLLMNADRYALAEIEAWLAAQSTARDRDAFTGEPVDHGPADDLIEDDAASVIEMDAYLARMAAKRAGQPS